VLNNVVLCFCSFIIVSFLVICLRSYVGRQDPVGIISLGLFDLMFVSLGHLVLPELCHLFVLILSLLGLRGALRIVL